MVSTTTDDTAQVRAQLKLPGAEYPVRVGEFWTSKQRCMHSLHYAVSYRASFKPELPDYFIRRYTQPGDVVFDPFGGRGTTALQANLLGRVGFANDINPLSERISYPKTHPVLLADIERVLSRVDLSAPADLAEAERADLLPFYHEDTLKEIVNLRACLREDRSDAARFIEMIALSRLHGHSPGFLSVYSFPQISVPASNQIRINERRGQIPDYRPVKPRILRKARRILTDADVDAIRRFGERNVFTTGDSRDLADVPSDCAALIVTSPPFLDKADYVIDNWLEFWFLDIDLEAMRRDIFRTTDLEKWERFMLDSMREMRRVLRPGGACVIEVGEVYYRGAWLNLDEVIAALAPEAGFRVEEVLIHVQTFTKLANTFNVRNNTDGTNTHRLVTLRK